MKNVLVTGSEGFIGSHLVENLLRSGVNVRCFVKYNSFSSWGWLDTFPDNIKKSLDVYPGDICDFNCVKNALKGCDTVFHLAALITIPYSYTASESYVETNIRGSLNVLRASLELAIKKIIFTSTSEVYGSAQYVPIDEKHPLNAQSPYAASKIGADQMAMSFYYSFGLPVSIVRPFNTYGPRQSARAVIPSIITQILSGKKELKIGSLKTSRDFNFIEDTINGFIAAEKSSKTVGQVINIGSGNEYTIFKTVEIITELLGSNIKIIGEKKRLRPENSEVDRLLCNNNKAKLIAGWIPEYATEKGFRRGLEKTIKWFLIKENQEYYKSNIYNY